MTNEIQDPFCDKYILHKVLVLLKSSVKIQKKKELLKKT